MGLMTFEKVGRADWFDVVLPFHFGMPQFDPVLILTMTLIMIVVMIESTGMFLALGEMTDRKISQQDLARGLRTDGLGTLIGGIFNTFPYTSFSQNVGLVAVTGIKSRYVCVAGGVILIVLGLLPKMAALVESLPTVVLGGAGLVMFGMVAATGIRILAGVNFKTNRYNPMIVAVSIGVGMIPLIAPNFKQWMPHAIHSLIESGILLASITAVLLNLFLNGAKQDDEADHRGGQAGRGALEAGLASDTPARPPILSPRSPAGVDWQHRTRRGRDMLAAECAWTILRAEHARMRGIADAARRAAARRLLDEGGRSHRSPPGLREATHSPRHRAARPAARPLGRGRRAAEPARRGKQALRRTVDAGQSCAARRRHQRQPAPCGAHSTSTGNSCWRTWIAKTPCSIRRPRNCSARGMGRGGIVDIGGHGHRRASGLARRGLCAGMPADLAVQGGLTRGQRILVGIGRVRRHAAAPWDWRPANRFQEAATRRTRAAARRR